MKFWASQEKLDRRLQTVVRAVSPRSPQPVLSGILVRVSAPGNDGQAQLELSATNADISLHCTMPVRSEAEGEIVLPARYLTEIVRRMPPGDLEIEILRPNQTATLRRQRSEYVIHGLPAEDFPPFPAADGKALHRVQQAVLKELVLNTNFAVSRDELRPVLTGSLMEIEGELIRLVATDGVRIAACEGPLLEKAGAAASLIVPGTGLAELARILSSDLDVSLDLKIGRAEGEAGLTNRLHFSLAPSPQDTTDFVTRLVDGQFPRYQQVIPQQYTTVATCAREELLEACSRAALIAEEGASTLRLQLGSDQIVLTANTPEVGKVYEEVPVEVQGEGLEIAFNARYLVEALDHSAGDQVVFEFTGAESPARIRPPEGTRFFHLVLPLRTVSS